MSVCLFCLIEVLLLNDLDVLHDGNGHRFYVDSCMSSVSEMSFFTYAGLLF